MKIGVLGNGQLARMLALAGKPMGLDFAFYSARGDGCADALGTNMGGTCRGEMDDLAALADFASVVDIVTVENENIPAASLQSIPADKIFPPAAAVITAQDRLREKRFFQSLDIPVAAYYEIQSATDLRHALARHKNGVVLKTRRDGYDGRGQVRIHQQQDIAAALDELQGHDLIAEEIVAFDREISIIAVRAKTGETRYYPVSENRHRNGILQTAAARRADPLQPLAQDHARRLADELNYVGVLCCEFFVCGDALTANEFAPRVHNSGHWSIDGATTSQFENHLRAICDMPLGCARVVRDCVMYNVIGRWPDKTALLGTPGAHMHDYQKTARPGRKVGHITLCGDGGRETKEARAEIERILARL